MPVVQPYSTETRQLAAAVLAAKIRKVREDMAAPAWVPQSRPQDIALRSTAHELFYGGAAGGGKTDLILGAAATVHHKSIIFRRQFPQLKDIILRSSEIYGAKWPSARYNKTDHSWTLPGGRTVELGSMPNIEDRQKYQGRPHDLKAFDEITQFMQEQYLYIIAWNRTTRPNQQVRAICTGNPPMTAEGEWVLSYWAAWLDDEYPGTHATAGEVRWFATIEGVSREVENHLPFEWKGQAIEPRSRTFIPARLTDNPYLSSSGYSAVLNALPEPLRSLLLQGFAARIEPASDPWQVIPTAWIKAAQDRWRTYFGERDAFSTQQQRAKNLAAYGSRFPDDPIAAIGADVARGGEDRTVIAVLRLTGHPSGVPGTVTGLSSGVPYIDDLVLRRGTETPNGETAAAVVIEALGLDPNDLNAVVLSTARGRTPVNIDIIGPGSSVYDVMKKYSFNVYAVHGNATSGKYIRERTLKTHNLRAEMYWNLRQLLDPDYGVNLMLPPDRELATELTAPKWYVATGGDVMVYDKPTVAKILGRSPDKADAVALSCLNMVDRHLTPFIPPSTSYKQYFPDSGSTAPLATSGYQSNSGTGGHHAAYPTSAGQSNATMLTGQDPQNRSGYQPNPLRLGEGCATPDLTTGRSSVTSSTYQPNYPHYHKSIEETRKGNTIYVPGHGDLTQDEVAQLIETTSGAGRIKRAR